ncbi:MAG: hypothetical protein AAGK93_00500 [Pseudomonadota bacterium]
MSRPAGTKTDDFRKHFNWMIGRFKKLGLEIAGVDVDVENNRFSILTPAASKAEVDEFTKWENEQNQE